MLHKPPHFAFTFLLCFGVVSGTQHIAVAGGKDVVAKLEASRLSGPAPLAVMFDATRTMIPAPADPFREVTYDFNFGDDRSLVWAHSGQPRNTQSGGPLAAHVYDLPGTYTVRLRATAPDGQTSEALLDINVEDPAKVYSGEKTVCVSPSGQFSGCPAKAARDVRLPVSYGGKRILLNRGETFGIVSINRNSDDILVGSYGSGSKPAVSQVIINSGHLNEKFVDDLIIMDVSILNGILHLASGSRYLFYRNDLIQVGGNNSIDIGGALHYQAERNPRFKFYHPREIFIVGNNIRGQVNTSAKPFINLAASGAYFAIVGNDISRSQEHTVRLFAVHKGYVAHNALRGMSHGAGPDGSGGSIRHVLKVHSEGFLPYSDAWTSTARRWATSQLILADNELGNSEDNGYFSVKIAPQNYDEVTLEGIEDVIIERNRFHRGPHTNTEVEFVGRRITVRENIRVDGGVPNLSIGQPSETYPAGWHGPYFRQ